MSKPIIYAWIIALFGLYPAAFCLLRIQFVRELCNAVGHGTTNEKMVSLVKCGAITDSEYRAVRDSYRVSCRGVHGNKIRQPRRTIRQVINAIRILRRVTA